MISTDTEAVPEHPSRELTVTWYVVVVLGDTLISDVLAPLFQEYWQLSQFETTVDRVTLSPLQSLTYPGCTATVGLGLTVTFTLLIS